MIYEIITMNNQSKGTNNRCILKIIEKIKEIERIIENYWNENNIPEIVIKKEGDRKFYFLDGPPYVTGEIHIGTAWNKILKDTILRYKRMRGFKVWCIPGYDTHGLPIEITVERKLGIKNKKEIERMGVDRFIEECKKLVERNIQIQTSQFKKLAVWMDWDNYYATYRDDYISRVWYVIKEAHKKGLLGREKRVFHWCPRCQTVLSDHEVALGYKNVPSPSIYVKFPLVDDDASLLIWTTTPWTLPSNVAVAVHPEMAYLKVRLRRTGEKLILMENRVSFVIKEPYEILDRFKGSKLAFKKYINPLQEYVPAQRNLREGHIVITSSEYVSPDEGTGLVHIAPEHGKEDFDLARKYQLPIITLIDDQGIFTDNAGKYSGLYAFDADKIIIEDLKKLNALYKAEVITHRYPHCWRCHTPLILKTTDQWILYLTRLKDKMLNENRKIDWIPRWAGEERFGKWLETARDWVISRQRYWGTPAPIWVCDRCGYIEVIGSKEELEEKTGTCIELHKPYIDTVKLTCPKCGSKMSRIKDVLDVWIDSGAASWASIEYPDKTDKFKELWPVDFILEGEDQTRGWFYSLLALGVIIFNESPYKSVLMHGYAVDELGRAMHKSLGNVISPEEILERYSVDILRLFSLDHPPWEDLRVSFRKMDEAARTLNIVLNVFEFFDMYASIDQYKWDETRFKRNLGMLLEEDKWILSLFERTLQEINEDMEKYHIHSALRRALQFIIEELSRKYIKIVRRRIWIEEEKIEKITAYDTLYYILDRVTRILAPFMPHISEYLYLNIISKYRKERYLSVHLMAWPDENKDLINIDLIAKYKLMWDLISTLISIKQSKNIKVRQPLEYALLPYELYCKLTDRQREIISILTNIQDIRYYSNEEEILNYIDISIKPKFDKLGPKYKSNIKYILSTLEDLPKELKWSLYKGNPITINVENLGALVIHPDEIAANIVESDGFAHANFKNSLIIVNTRIHTELLYEGIAKDIVRRIQYMRKELKLNVLDYIIVYIDAESKEILDAINSFIDYIKSETRAREIKVTKDLHGLIKKWIIDDNEVTIGVKRVE